MRIPLIKPYIDDGIKKAVADVLDSGYLTEGPVTRELEKSFAEYIGVPYAIAVTSCTTGLEIALRAAGIGPGDEVIVPDYTYPATASVVTMVGAHCVIVDIDPETMLIDYESLESAITPKTRAIIPVSLFGNPLDYDRLNDLKHRYKFYVIEDAACAIGSEFKGGKVGSFADITVFSMHPRKFITTGEGGMITTGNKQWAEWMDSYKHFGIDMSGQSREGVVFNIPGTNYKLSNILAAVGLGQMKQITTLIERRRQLALNYDRMLRGVRGLRLPKVTTEGRHSFQSYCVMTSSRDKLLKVLRSEGIEVQIGTYALHMHPAFSDPEMFTFSGGTSNSTVTYNECLALPLFHDLKEDEQEYIVRRIKELI